MGRLEVYDHEGNIVEVVDTRDLTEEKEKFKQYVNEHRDKVLNGGIVCNDVRFDSDERSRANITGVAAAIGAGIALPEGFTWRDYDNIEREMTAEQFLVMAQSVLTFVNTVYAVYAVSWLHKNAIDNLETFDEVNLYDYTVGWPE